MSLMMAPPGTHQISAPACERRVEQALAAANGALAAMLAANVAGSLTINEDDGTVSFEVDSGWKDHPAVAPATVAVADLNTAILRAAREDNVYVLLSLGTPQRPLALQMFFPRAALLADSPPIPVMNDGLPARVLP